LQAPSADNLARLGPESQLTLLGVPSGTEGDSYNFELGAGSVWLIRPEASNQATVATPAGVATLVGSSMGVEYYADYAGTGGQLMRVLCPAGGCTVENAFGGVELPAGHQAEVQGTAGPDAARPIEPEQWAEWYASVPEAPQLAALCSEVCPEDNPLNGVELVQGLPTATPEPKPTLTATRVPTETPAPTETAVAVQPLEVQFNSDAGRLSAGQCTTLRWATKNASGVWLGGQSVRATDAQRVCPVQTTTYSLTVEGPGGREVRQVTIQVSSPPPATTQAPPIATTQAPPPVQPSLPGANLWADSTALAAGECTSLHWMATNAKEVYLNGQGIAGETSRQVCPGQTTTYTLKVVGYDNSTAESATTINVTPASGPPGADIWSDSGTLAPGECTTLRWAASNAKEVYLNGQGIAGESSRQVCPYETTTYTLQVVGQDGSTAQASTTIKVSAPPSYSDPTLSANPNPVYLGCDGSTSNTTISWSAPGATSVTISGFGQVAASGSQGVCLTDDASYDLTATYPDGSQKYAYVFVDVVRVGTGFRHPQPYG
jgi:hypothetical protein